MDACGDWHGAGWGGGFVFCLAPKLPPPVVGLIAALMGILRMDFSALDLLPALAVGTAAIPLCGQPFLLGEYPDNKIRLPLLFWTVLALCAVGPVYALVKGRSRGFCWRTALVLALAVLVACAAFQRCCVGLAWEHMQGITLRLVRPGAAALPVGQEDAAGGRVDHAGRRPSRDVRRAQSAAGRPVAAGVWGFL